MRLWLNDWLVVGTDRFDGYVDLAGKPQHRPGWLTNPG